MTQYVQEKTITFTLDGKQVTASADESIWQIAKREGTTIPHLCHKDAPSYRPDGNCRACMVEIEGERVLAASCIRKPSENMVVKTGGSRVETSRKMLFEALAADQPLGDEAHDDGSDFWYWAGKYDMTPSLTDKRLPENPFIDQAISPDLTHPAMAVNLDACIQCGLCVRACREVQHNDVIGMAGRGAHSKIIFDLDEDMGRSTCVACGECVQACPTGALLEKSVIQVDKGTIQADKVIDSLCPYCGVGCQTTAYVKDNRLIKVEGRNGPANENRLCVKGRFGFDYVHHDGRLTTPLKRRADAPPKQADMKITNDNLYDYFEEISWQEAMALSANGLKQIYSQDGGEALAGFGSAKGSNEEAYLFQKLIRQAFGTNNVDHCTRLCHASSVAALMEGLNSGAVSAPFTAAKDAEVIIVIGARPAENHPVAATYIKEAAHQGAKLIVMDPRGQTQGLSRYADHIVQFKAGSDVALINSMIHTIITENLVDHDYINQFVEGYEDLKAGIDAFTPEKMQEICCIDADKIRELARLYATAKSSLIFWGMGVSQHVHGTDNVRALIALSLITGQIGRDGTGLHPLRGQNNVQGASDSGLIPMVYPNYQKVNDPQIQAKFEKAWGAKLSNKPGLTVVEIVDAIHANQIKGMYIMGENPAMSDPDQTHARAALAKLDHLIVQDIFMTETAWFADVILPASAHAEKMGSFTNTNREVQIARPILDLPGEARQDWHLIQDLANHLGLDWQYNHISEVYAEMASLMPSLDNITWDRLENEGAVTYPCPHPNSKGEGIIFKNGFPTATGKARIVPTDYTPPAELPDDDYPFVLTTGRLLEHWHTGAMTRRATTLDRLEPEAIACLNRFDMEKMALTPGNMVKVKTRRGEVSLKVRMDHDVPEGMVFIPFCFNEAAANLLTNPVLDPYGKIPEFKFCAAQIEV